TRGAVAEHDVAEPGGSLVARPLIELVEEAPRLRSGARRSEAAHDRALRDRAREYGEAAATKNLGHILDDERVAQIRLVAAVPRQRLVVGNPRERRRRHLRLRPEFAED